MIHKMRRSIYSTIVIALLIFGLGISANASIITNDNIVDDVNYQATVDSVLDRFIKDFSNTDNARLIILNQQAQDVTGKWKETLDNLMEENRLEEIIEVITDEGLIISYEEKKILPLNEIEPKGSVRQTKVTQKFYHRGTTPNGTKHGWYMNLTGYIKHSTVTGKILSATSPSVSIESFSMGNGWSPWLTNVSSGCKVYPSYVDFWGKYTMMAVFGPSGALGAESFGIFTMNMRGYPQF